MSITGTTNSNDSTPSGGPKPGARRHRRWKKRHVRPVFGQENNWSRDQGGRANYLVGTEERRLTPTVPGGLVFGQSQTPQRLHRWSPAGSHSRGGCCERRKGGPRD